MVKLPVFVYSLPFPHIKGSFGSQFSWGFQTLYISCLFDERLLTPIQCRSNEILWKLIFAINSYKRTSEIPGIWIVEPDTGPWTVSLKRLLSYIPTLGKISRPKDNYGSNNKFSLHSNTSLYTCADRITRQQTPTNLSMPFTLWRVNRPCWGHKFIDLFLKDKIQRGAKPKGKLFPIVLFIAGIQRR